MDPVAKPTAAPAIPRPTKSQMEWSAPNHMAALEKICSMTALGSSSQEIRVMLVLIMTEKKATRTIRYVLNIVEIANTDSPKLSR
ncbi:hypothetical protein EEB12_29055 [Rhodococcus sp. WS1]|nr:hypothetical protein EEB12_29055 [Rhodococcus sp. WS1]